MQNKISREVTRPIAAVSVAGRSEKRRRIVVVIIFAERLFLLATPWSVGFSIGLFQSFQGGPELLYLVTTLK